MLLRSFVLTAALAIGSTAVYLTVASSARAVGATTTDNGSSFFQHMHGGAQSPEELHAHFDKVLTEAQVRQLATYAIAGADGLFIAKEVGGDSVDLVTMFEIHGQALYATAQRMIAENEG